MRLNNTNPTVIKGYIARALLKKGHKVIDIRPFRDEEGNMDFQRSVFVFEYDDTIFKDLEQISSQTNKEEKRNQTGKNTVKPL